VVSEPTPDPTPADSPSAAPASKAAVDQAAVDQAADGQISLEAGTAEAPAPAGFGAATLAELRKVVWPSRQQLFSESVAVILMVGLSAAAIAAIDRFYGWAAAQVFR
jgi:preprotein translocase subunit SecE